MLRRTHRKRGLVSGLISLAIAVAVMVEPVSALAGQGGPSAF